MLLIQKSVFRPLYDQGTKKLFLESETWVLPTALGHLILGTALCTLINL